MTLKQCVYVLNNAGGDPARVFLANIIKSVYTQVVEAYFLVTIDMQQNQVGIMSLLHSLQA